MSNQKKLIYGIVMVLLMAAFLANRTAPPKKTAAVLNRIPASQSTSTADVAVEPPSAPVAVPAAASAPAATVSREFIRWFGIEAQKIEARDSDALATEAELKERVQHFSKAEVSYLATRMSSSLAPASERILASYLVGLAANTSADLLVDTASQAVEDPGPHPPHSIAEAKAAQERAYKIMAVDAIYNSDLTVAQKIDKLGAIVNHSPDNTVKQYAADKVDDLHQL